MVKSGNTFCRVDLLNSEVHLFLLVPLIEDRSCLKWRSENDFFSFNDLILFCKFNMSSLNQRFIYANLLRAADLRIPVDVIFNESLSKTVNAWERSLRMDSSSITIALFNIVATTLEFSSVSRSFDDRYQVPLNFYNMILARSCIIMTFDSTKLHDLF